MVFSGDRSLVSRICRLRLFAVLAAIPSVLIPANAASGGVLFQSNWDTAAGTSTTAVTDGGRGPTSWDFNTATAAHSFSALSGGPTAANPLPSNQRAPPSPATARSTKI